ISFVAKLRRPLGRDSKAVYSCHSRALTAVVRSHLKWSLGSSISSRRFGTAGSNRRTKTKNGRRDSVRSLVPHPSANYCELMVRESNCGEVTRPLGFESGEPRNAWANCCGLTLRKEAERRQRSGLTRALAAQPLCVMARGTTGLRRRARLGNCIGP